MQGVEKKKTSNFLKPLIFYCHSGIDLIYFCSELDKWELVNAGDGMVYPRGLDPHCVPNVRNFIYIIYHKEILKLSEVDQIIIRILQLFWKFHILFHIDTLHVHISRYL